MERYLGRRPYTSVSTMYKRRKRKGKKSRGGAYKQGYNARLDESLSQRHPGKKGKYSTRRKQSKGMERYLGRRPYASVSTMYKRRKGKGKKSRGGAYQQGYNARLDESLAKRHPGKKGKYSTRRKQSKGMERYLGRRPYASVSTMYKRRKGKGKRSRGGNRLMENVRLLQNQAFIKGQTNPLFRALSHSGGSPAPISPNRVQPADSNNWWVGENGQTFFAPTRQAAFNQSMALGNHPATKSMKQNRWVPFTR
jgi:hypothetical protein